MSVLVVDDILWGQMATQHEIALHLLDGSTRPAVRTGNNAAWDCPCGREAPLIGALQIGGRGSVTCPNCNKHYQVIGSGVDDRGEHAGVPVRVEEREAAR